MSILTQIGSWIVGGAIIIAGIFGGVPAQSPANVSLGTGATNFTPVQVPRTYLYGSGIGATDTSVKLTSLKTTNGQTVGMSAFGTIGYATIDAAIPNKEENISFTGVTQNSDGTAILTGVTRGLLPVYPYTASSTYQVSHSGGASVIFSNSAPFYSQFSFWGTTTTVTGNWTFASTSIPVFDTTSSNIFTNVADIVSKAYVDSQIAAGAAPISTTTAGIGIFATIGQTASGTATSTYNSQVYGLIPQNKNFSATGGVSQVVPVTNASGTLDTSFINQGTNYNWTGGQTFASSTTFTTSSSVINNASTTFSATTTFNGQTTINGTFIISTSTQLSHIRVFTTSTTWTVPSGVTQVYVTLIGGGGGGSGASSGGSYSGGSGSSGDWREDVPITVTPGANITIVVGIGGLGTAPGTPSSAGNSGTSSSFITSNSTTTVSGGLGGVATNTGGCGGGSAASVGTYSNAGITCSNTNVGANGVDSPMGFKGLGQATATGTSPTGFGSSGAGGGYTAGWGSNGAPGVVIVKW